MGTELQSCKMKKFWRLVAQQSISGSGLGRAGAQETCRIRLGIGLGPRLRVPPLLRGVGVGGPNSRVDASRIEVVSEYLLGP